MKKTFMGFIVAIVMLMLSGVAGAGVPDCEKNRSPNDIEQCKEARLRMLTDEYTRFTARLLQDDIVPISRPETKALREYHMTRWQEMNNRCKTDRDCKWDELIFTYSEVKKFADKKIRENQQRLAATPVQRSTFGGAPAKPQESPRAYAERMNSPAGMAKSKAVLDQYPERSSDDEEGE